MKKLNPNLNFNYPLEDFKADISGASRVILEKPYGKIPNLKIEMPDGEKRDYAFNTNHPMFQVTQYFFDKYGAEEGTRRHIKFNLVGGFLSKYEKMLIEKGIMIRLNGQIVESTRFNNFMDFLLKYKIPKSNEIPIKVVKEFLNRQP